MGNTYTKIAETRNEWQRQVMISIYLAYFGRAIILLNPLN